MGRKTLPEHLAREERKALLKQLWQLDRLIRRLKECEKRLRRQAPIVMADNLQSAS